MIVQHFGIEARALPVLTEPIHGDPLHLVVGQSPGGEPDLARIRIAPLRGDGVDLVVDRHLGVGMIPVRGLRPDDVRHRDAFRGQRLGHDIGGLLLPVDLAAISHQRAIEEVDRVIGRVVEMPQLGFPRRGLQRFLLPHLEEIRRFAEARPGCDSGPEAREMGSEMTGRRAAHAESTHHDAVRIDLVLALHRVQRFEQVHFAGQLVGVAVATVQVQHDGVGRRKLTRIMLALPEEVDFVQGLAAPMKPGVETPAMGPRGREGRRHNQPIRLHAAIDFRHVAARYQAGRGSPGSGAGCEGIGAQNGRLGIRENDLESRCAGRCQVERRCS